MKKNRITVFTLAVLVLILSFFCSSPADEQIQESPMQNTIVREEMPSQTQTPEANNKKKKAPVQEKEIYQEEAENYEDVSLMAEEQISEKTENLFCTLLVRCDSVLESMDLLSEAKRKIIPEDGIIYPEQLVEFSDGESVFDVLLREMRRKEIHLEFVDTPMYNSAYIEGIGNLYEFDCGDMSGWQYRVNGSKPNYGSSQYKLKNGDSIEFYYTINFMKDK